MKVYNRYIVSLVLVACVVNILLAFLGQNDLSFYFIVNVICYLIITLLYTYFNPRVRKTLNTLGIVFFSGFVVIAIIEVVGIISG